MRKVAFVATETDNGRRAQAAAIAREFKKGAAQPSLPALLGILLVAGALFLLCLTVLTPDFIGAHAPGYFMVSDKDDSAYISAKTLAIRRNRPPDPSVVIVGASAVREACSDVDLLEKRLAETLGYRVNVFLLAAPNLTAWEQAWIVNTLQDSYHGLLVMDVSPRKMVNTTDFLAQLVESPRLALPAEELAGELRAAGLEPPREYGNFFLENYKFFIARPSAVFNVARGPFKARHHRSGDWRIFDEEQWAGAVERLAGYYELYRRNSEANFAVLGRVLNRLDTNPGVQAALLESTMNQRLCDDAARLPELGAWLEQYTTDIDAFAREHAVPYWNLDREAGLEPDEFVDTSHLHSAEAMRRYAEVLAEKLASLLAKTKGKDPDNE